MSNKLGAFVVGGLVGAAVALLYAPRTGVETRALVTEKMNTAWGGAQDFGAQAQVNAQQAYQTAVERGQVVAQDVEAGTSAAYGTIITLTMDSGEDTTHDAPTVTEEIDPANEEG